VLIIGITTLVVGESMKLKSNDKVKVVPTSYLNELYTSHVGGDGKIVEEVPDSECRTPYVKDYVVKIGRTKYVFPEYSLEK